VEEDVVYVLHIFVAKEAVGRQSYANIVDVLVSRSLLLWRSQWNILIVFWIQSFHIQPNLGRVFGIGMELFFSSKEQTLLVEKMLLLSPQISLSSLSDWRVGWFSLMVWVMVSRMVQNGK